MGSAALGRPEGRPRFGDRIVTIRLTRFLCCKWANARCTATAPPTVWKHGAWNETTMTFACNKRVKNKFLPLPDNHCIIIHDFGNKPPGIRLFTGYFCCRRRIKGEGSRANTLFIAAPPIIVGDQLQAGTPAEERVLQNNSTAKRGRLGWDEKLNNAEFTWKQCRTAFPVEN